MRVNEYWLYFPLTLEFSHCLTTWLKKFFAKSAIYNSIIWYIGAPVASLSPKNVGILRGCKMHDIKEKTESELIHLCFDLSFFFFFLILFYF